MDWNKVSMVYFALVSLMVLLLLSWFLFWRILDRLMKDQQRREDSWTLERERLLNRSMSKEWTTYAQMTGSMQSTSTSDIPGSPPVGLSTDEEEFRRSGYPTPEGLDFDLNGLTGGNGVSSEPTIGADD